MPFTNRFNIVVLCDLHVPYENQTNVEAAFGFCAKLQPQILVLHELHDFYSLSRFSKDPARIDCLQEELDKVTTYLRVLRGLCPKSRMILLDSNHQSRLKRYLWTVAPGLNSLRALQVENLLELGPLRIEHAEDFLHRNFLFKHGDLVSKESGMTARRELAKEGLSGCSGHTHRLGQIYKRNRSGLYTWIESGCLCDMHPEWLRGTADWMPGLSVVSFNDADSDMFYATVVPVIEGRVLL